MEEKTYTVAQIAEILNTNQETVRRWIRHGDLKATQTSKKQGNIVTENSFQNFLLTSPKYFPIAQKSAMSSALACLLGGTAVGLVVGIANCILDMKNTDYMIGDVELQEYLDSEIKKKEEEIKKNKKAIAELELKNQMQETEIIALRDVKQKSDLVAQTITNALICGINAQK